MTFNFDPCDYDGMLKIMDEHCNDESMSIGENENGEAVTISVYKDMIVTVTCQDNGWMRKNFYYRDGGSEETFEPPERKRPSGIRYEIQSRFDFLDYHNKNLTKQQMKVLNEIKELVEKL